MTRGQLERFVRSQVEGLDPELQECVFARALGRAVVCWPNLTSEELGRVYGACRAIGLIAQGF